MNKAIMLAINPTHVNNIFAGDKTIELRKVKCAEDVNKLYIYETAPISKVVGEAEIEKCVVDYPSNLMTPELLNSACVDESFYKKYYNNCKYRKVCAYYLTNVVQYDIPKELENFGISTAPQSFVYINE